MKHLTQLENYRVFFENLIIIKQLKKFPDEADSSEMFPTIYQTTERHILEDSDLNIQRHETFKYHTRHLQPLRKQTAHHFVYVSQLFRTLHSTN
jgi:hypothetical protein